MNTGFEQIEISELWKMGKDAADQYTRTNDLFTVTSLARSTQR